MIADPELVLNGYQPHLVTPGTGLFHLTHLHTGCNTTVTVKVNSFRMFYEGPEFEDRNMGKHSCPGYCLDPNNFEPCSEGCDLKWIRDIMQMFKNHSILPNYGDSNSV